MKPQTVQLLNRLNHLFYQKVAKNFDRTRERPWSGWFDLLPPIRALPGDALRVLDVGCGNGRFGLFLDEQLHRPFHYIGIDSSAFLLERAADALTAQNIPHTLQAVDLLNAAYQPEPLCDVVVMFGVIHHVPGFDNRQQVIRDALAWTKPGGLLVIAFWQFYENERLRNRVVAWDDPKVPDDYHDLDIEQHDYLLDWRAGAYALRYCHHTDAAEIGRLLAGMTIISAFDADNSNRYVVIRKD